MELINTDLIIKYTDKELSKTEELKFEKTLNHNKSMRQELQIHKHLNSFMKRRFRLEQDSESEQSYNAVDQFAKEAISDYLVDEQAYSDISGFIRRPSDLQSLEKETIKDLKSNSIDLIARNWVDQWKNELENTKQDQKYLDDIRSFVAKGMNIDENNEKKRLKVVSKNSKNHKLVLIFNNWYYSVASAAALFLISFGLWKFVDKPMDNDELFVNFYHPYTLVSDQTRSSTKELIGQYEVASSYYINENYSEAALIFKKALDSNIEQVDIRFLYAISLVELKNYEEAILEFDTIISIHDSYNLESKWYLSLCYLKLDRINEAQELLIELSEKRSFYQSSAQDILDQLD
ncbi:MAG: tetratricopeptide repeat protein [Bacteroidota bacterium]